MIASVHGPKMAEELAQAFLQVAARMTDIQSSIREQGMVQGISPFHGDSKKYRRWIEEIEKTALLVGSGDYRKKMIAYETVWFGLGV